jgi:hypothetical protein
MSSSQALQVIGGEDLYKPVCRECFNDETLVKEMHEAQLEQDEKLKQPSEAQLKSMVEPQKMHTGVSSQ